jgi:UDP:flavonoid glycosyltransferase YjiC (YdhE family)
MSRFLFAWELGANFGHLAQFRPLARRLRSLGHDVQFALRDVTWAQEFLGREGFRCYQAPVWTPNAAKELACPPLSYAGILAQQGWQNEVALGGVVRAWRDLYRLVRPDVLVASHAPTALLAATGLGFARARMGTGFACPPLENPFPAMRDWAPAPQAELLAIEADILKVVSRVMADFKIPFSPSALRDVFRTDAELLCTFAELDHYAARSDGQYRGPIFIDDEGIEPEWPQGKGGRIFAYLSAGYSGLSTVLAQLRDSGRPILAVIPGISSAAAEAYKSNNLRVSAQPARISSVAAQCELAICHGGHGTTAAMLLAGVPLLLLPQHLEQFLLARRIERMGAGVIAGRELSADKLALSVASALGNAGCVAKAQTFRTAHAVFDRDEQLSSTVAKLAGISTSSRIATVSAVS